MAYLTLYAFPAETPISPALTAIYKAAGKLRQAYLIRKQLEDLDPTLHKKVQKLIRKRKKQFLQVYDTHRRLLRQQLRNWKRQFPLPWLYPETQQSWKKQTKNWINLVKAKLRAYPPPPYTPQVWHEIRKWLRQWELAKTWVSFSDLPPSHLTKKLGDARDLYLLLRWLEKQGLSETPTYTQVQAAYTQKEQEALMLWQAYRSAGSS
ncbi:MAG: hypothetical protein RMJ66_06480 [Bacteroidia bacterium]|nr:hypothetical protein [Bacteroidia bacterium]MDW8134698.1 hypothetical protein [Bacteroidia bacterium]